MSDSEDDNCVITTDITILPISGGYFINQVALISLLCDIGYKPKIILASSGGAIASYIGMCGHWNTNGIFRVMEDLNSDVYCDSWWGQSMSYYLPSGLIGFFKGSIYKNGYGTGEMLSKYLTKNSIIETEIWVGTYNMTTSCAEMICNKSYKNSVIRCNDRIPTIPFKMNYLDGNFDSIGKAIYSSAAIPTVVPSIELNGEKYYDGGLLYASPIIPLSDYLPKCLKIIYISSYNIEEQKASPVDKSNIFQIGYGALTETATGRCMVDRLFAIRLVMRCDKTNYNHYDNIKEAMVVYNSSKRAVIELYPKDNYCVDITNFEGIEIKTMIKRIKTKYGVRLWWSD